MKRKYRTIVSLHEAMEQDDFDLKIAQQLIDEGADVNELQDGDTPLYAAIFWNDLLTAQFLLEHGADPKISERQSDDPLSLVTHLIASHGYSDMMNLLLEKGVYSDNQILNDSFLLALSCSESVKIIKLFLEHGADIGAVALKGDTALHRAVDNPHLKVLEFMLDQGLDIECRNSTTNFSALQHAINSRRARKCELLVKRGAMINARNSRVNRTPLSLTEYACGAFVEDYARIAQVLLEHAAVLRDARQANRLVFIARKFDNDKLLNLVLQQVAIMERLNIS